MKPLKNYEYFKTDLGTLYCGDCLDILPLLKGNSIDLVLTSPPYNVGIIYEQYDDFKQYDEYMATMDLIFSNIKNILKKDGRLLCNIPIDANTAFEKIRVSPLIDFGKMFQNINLKYHGTALWTKNNQTSRTAWGSFLSASAPYVNQPYETIMILYKELWKKENKGITKIDKKLFMEMATGLWNFKAETNANHPAPFPEKLVTNCVKFFNFENDVTLDPFLGSGTTALVCEKMGRKWIGIEISEKYCEVAKERIETESKQVKLF